MEKTLNETSSTYEMEAMFTSFEPQKYETPQLIQLSHSANIPDLECLGGKGSSCSWK